jgi:hypothetical protein
VFLGLAFVMKQPGLLFGVFGGLLVLREGFRQRVPWRARTGHLLIFLAGWLLPLSAVCLWLAGAGVFQEFLFWTFRYASNYGSIVPWDVGLQVAWINWGKIFRTAPLIWILILAGVPALAFTKGASPVSGDSGGGSDRLFPALWLLFSLLAVSPGNYYRGHYFILLLPAASLFGGIAVTVLQERLGGGGARNIVPVALAALACIQGLLAERRLYFTLSPDAASRSIYRINPFPEMPEVARFLREHTTPEQTVAVMGSEPELFFLSGRKSSTGQIYAYPLLERQPLALRMQEMLFEDLEKHPPEYVVFVRIPPSWDVGTVDPANVPGFMERANRYVSTRMRLVGLIETTDAGPVRSVWGPEAATTPRTTPGCLEVYERVHPGPGTKDGDLPNRP